MFDYVIDKERQSMTGYWDIHNHILPGLDDGSGSMQETLELVQSEHDQGVRHIVFTPHYRRGMFEIPQEEKQAVFHRAYSQLADQFPDMHFYLGCEYYADPHMMRRIGPDDSYRMPGGEAVLTEFGYEMKFGTLMNVVNALCKEELIPIMAHIERYQCLLKDMDLLTELKAAGAKLQINCDSVIGKSGFKVKRYCMKALEAGLIDFVASDAHNMGQRSVHIAEAVKQVRSKCGDDVAENIFCTNPSRLFAGYELRQ